MKDGFIRVCAATPDIRVADCAYNEKNIMNLMDEAYEKQVSVLVFPELCITGYTCGDLFLQDVLLKAAQDSPLAQRRKKYACVCRYAFYAQGEAL